MTSEKSDSEALVDAIVAHRPRPSTTHTPGPWRVEGEKDPKYPDLTTWCVLAPNPDANKTNICYSGNELTVVFNTDHEADARLIAAAPDLLAALEALVLLLDTTKGLATYKMARAAIAKARNLARNEE